MPGHGGDFHSCLVTALVTLAMGVGFALSGLGILVAICSAMSVKKVLFVVDMLYRGREIGETFTGGGWSATGTAVPRG